MENTKCNYPVDIYDYDGVNEMYTITIEAISFADANRIANRVIDHRMYFIVRDIYKELLKYT